MGYFKLNTDGSSEAFDLDADDLLRTLYKQINCDLVEHVSTPVYINSERIDLLVDESGAVSGRQKINRVASALAIQPIYGPAVPVVVDDDNFRPLNMEETGKLLGLCLPIRYCMIDSGVPTLCLSTAISSAVLMIDADIWPGHCLGLLTERLTSAVDSLVTELRMDLENEIAQKEVDDHEER